MTIYNTLELSGVLYHTQAIFKIRVRKNEIKSEIA